MVADSPFASKGEPSSIWLNQKMGSPGCTKLSGIGKDLFESEFERSESPGSVFFPWETVPGDGQSGPGLTFQQLGDQEVVLGRVPRLPLIGLDLIMSPSLSQSLWLRG